MYKVSVVAPLHPSFPLPHTQTRTSSPWQHETSLLGGGPGGHTGRRDRGSLRASALDTSHRRDLVEGGCGAGTGEAPRGRDTMLSLAPKTTAHRRGGRSLLQQFALLLVSERGAGGDGLVWRAEGGDVHGSGLSSDLDKCLPGTSESLSEPRRSQGYSSARVELVGEEEAS